VVGDVVFRRNAGDVQGPTAADLKLAVLLAGLEGLRARSGAVHNLGLPRILAGIAEVDENGANGRFGLP
jgi:hypothetical protein